MNSALYFGFSNSPHWGKRGRTQLGSPKKREGLNGSCLLSSHRYLTQVFFPEMLKQIRQGIQEQEKGKDVTILLKTVDLFWTAYTSQSGGGS